MRPIVMSRRLEVRTVGFDILQQKAFLSVNEIFVRTEVDHGGFILSVSLGVGSLDDLKCDRVKWTPYAASQPAVERLESEPPILARRVFDFNQSYQSMAPKDLPSTTIRRVSPVPGPTSSTPAAPSARPGDLARASSAAPVPSSSAVTPAPIAASSPVPSGALAPAVVPPRLSDQAQLPNTLKSRVSDFPELARVHEYDAGHNIDDVKERLAYQVNLKAVRAFAEGVNVKVICDRFALSKERLYRVLKSHRDKGRDGLIVLKRNRPNAPDNTRRGFDE